MGVKISELPTFSSPLTGNELVAVVQDSITSQTPLSAFVAPLTGVGGMLAKTELSRYVALVHNYYNTLL